MTNTWFWQHDSCLCLTISNHLTVMKHLWLVCCAVFYQSACVQSEALLWSTPPPCQVIWLARLLRVTPLNQFPQWRNSWVTHTHTHTVIIHTLRSSFTTVKTLCLLWEQTAAQRVFPRNHENKIHFKSCDICPHVRMTSLFILSQLKMMIIRIVTLCDSNFIYLSQNVIFQKPKNKEEHPQPSKQITKNFFVIALQKTIWTFSDLISRMTLFVSAS